MLTSLLLSVWALLAGVTSPHSDTCSLYPSEHERYGVNVVRNYGKAIDDYAVTQLNAGWYVDYTIQRTPVRPNHMSYVQTLLPSLHYPIQPEFLGPYVDENPGAVWVLGNEPDRDLQDAMTPEEYVVFYHDMRQFIKGRDPTAQIAIAGLVQPTPIRLRYLDSVLAAYQYRYNERFPVDIWTMHNFVLNEELNGWGAGIPVGLEDFASEGIRYEVRDHGRIDLFKQQIVDLRQWMSSNGYRDKPLIISEYGILLPDLYGYTDTVVGNFMVESFAFLQTAEDTKTGYPRDGNRLVQSWGWYSLNDYRYDIDTGIGLNGNLFDHDTGQITAVGNRFKAYIAPLVDNHSNLSIIDMTLEPAFELEQGSSVPVTVTVTLANGGNLPVDVTALRIIRGENAQDGTSMARTDVNAQLAERCQATLTVKASFSVSGWEPGLYPLLVTVGVQDVGIEKNLDDNRVNTSLWILQEGQELDRVFLPVLERP